MSKHSEAAGEKESGQAENLLALPVSGLEGIGPKRATLLAQLGIATLADLLYHFPTRYEDRTQLTPISELCPGVEATLRARVVKSRNVRLRGKLSVADVRVADHTGELKVIFFGRGFLANSVFRIGAEVILTGTLSASESPSLDNPDYEVLDPNEDAGLNTGRIVPVYPLSEGLGQRQLRRWVAQALDLIGNAQGITHSFEVLPPALRKRHNLLHGPEALRSIHFPESPDRATQARRTLALRELVILQTAILLERRAMKNGGGIAHKSNGPCLKQLHRLLPFTLTDEQDRIIAEVVRDMAAPHPMRRLVQGDVGSGKTMAALHAIAVAADTGCQSALMAPTEILATQHYLGLRPMLEGMGLNAVLLTGGSATPKQVREAIRTGAANVVMGTHALFQKATEFQRLGLVIIDEQHRFGVMQRQTLTDKGATPDLLQLTATPIPRTLALTAYGHLDVSVIRALPPGRQPIDTRHVRPARMLEMFDKLRREIAAGRQAYIVCPLIEESEVRQAKAAVTHHAELCAGPLAGLRVGLLHGRIPAEEKAATMQAFKAGEWDVLVCTTVIEVGVDCPNATVMIIEDAQQFSLSQLHQLRGRVGRGQHQSYCYLTGTPTTESGKKRVEMLCSSNDGFAIAEADLALRGPGAFYGVRQAGLSDLRAASLVTDGRLIEDARTEAEALLKKDAALSNPQHAALRRAVSQRGAPLPS